MFLEAGHSGTPAPPTWGPGSSRPMWAQAHAGFGKGTSGSGERTSGLAQAQLDILDTVWPHLNPNFLYFL